MAVVLPIGRYDAGPRTAAPVTHALSIACIGATALSLWRPELIAAGGVVPATVWGGEGAGLPGLAFLTAPWLHTSALHLVYNLAALWVFGPPVERHLGAARFAVLVLSVGTAALAAQALTMPGASVPIVGASGITTALLGAFLVLHARARVSVALLFMTVPVPIRVLAAIWMGSELATIFGSAAGWFPALPVAHIAHLTGFVLGAAILRFQATRADSSF